MGMSEPWGPSEPWFSGERGNTAGERGAQYVIA
jgi:hypothetical protein